MADSSPLVTLEDLPPRVIGRVVALDCGRSCRSRIEALGIRVGDAVERVPDPPACSPVQVRKENTLIDLGHGMARKVVVALPAPDCPACYRLGLRHLPPNVPATIVSIGAQGELGRRIRDMGLVPGTAVEVVGRAPLRDPVALRVRDFTLSLRNNEADYVQVQLGDCPAVEDE